jgi:hypothetical protein
MFEKAYVAAGFYGDVGKLAVADKSYGMVEGGSSGVAFTHLTGVAGTEHVAIQSDSDNIPVGIQSIMREKLRGVIDNFEYALLGTISRQLKDMAAKVFVAEDSLEALLKGLSHDFGTAKEPNVVTISQPTITIMLENVREQNLLTGALGSGKYTVQEVALFTDVRTKLLAGKMMTISTKEKIFDDGDEFERGLSGGEPMIKGLAGKHAYSLLDYAPKDHKQGDTLSLKLRNPWGTYGRTYVDEKTGEPIDISTGDTWNGAVRKADDSGIFWVDMADIMACCYGYDTI